MDTNLLSGSLNPFNLFSLIQFKINFAREHPNYFGPEGLLVFCGSQGSGKTLSAVQYTMKCMDKFYRCILCTNVEIKEFPINCFYRRKTVKERNIEKNIVEYYTLVSNQLVRRVTSFYKDGEQQSIIEDFDVIGFNGRIIIEYNGLDCLKEIENGQEGVLYLIDEIHLEFNSLESKNVPIEVMIEVSQQRKQRKHIVGTSQVYMRMAKPFREQIKNVVICRNFFRFLQWNRLIDGETSHEENGKLVFDTQKYIFWFHSTKLYNSYDTYKKMKRYRDEWKGVSRTNIYSNDSIVIKNENYN